MDSNSAYYIQTEGNLFQVSGSRTKKREQPGLCVAQERAPYRIKLPTQKLALLRWVRIAQTSLKGSFQRTNRTRLRSNGSC